MAYYYKHANDDQQKVVQYHKNLHKDPKRGFIPKTCIHNKSMTHEFTNAPKIDKSYQ